MNERYPCAHVVYPRALALIEQRGLSPLRAERLDMRAARILARRWVQFLRLHTYH